MTRMRGQDGAGRSNYLLGAALIVGLAACAGGDKPRGGDTAAAGTTTAAAPPTAPASAGQQTYQQICVTCHQANGEGVPGTFPPLAGSEYVLSANPAVPIRIVLRGLQGPITVKGAQYNGVMAPFGTGVALPDDQVAAVLTYVRTSWGNNASAITAEQVAAERAAQQGQTTPLSADDLKPLM